MEICWLNIIVKQSLGILFVVWSCSKLATSVSRNLWLIWVKQIQSKLISLMVMVNSRLSCFGSGVGSLTSSATSQLCDL